MRLYSSRVGLPRSDCTGTLQFCCCLSCGWHDPRCGRTRQRSYSMDQPSEPLSVWVIIGAYIMPIIVSVFTLWRQLRKDKAEISQISNDIEHTDHEETVSESQISLEWAKQFKERLDKVETANAQLMGEISNLRLKNLELEAKVVSLGETNRLHTARGARLRQHDGPPAGGRRHLADRPGAAGGPRLLGRASHARPGRPL